MSRRPPPVGRLAAALQLRVGAIKRWLESRQRRRAFRRFRATARRCGFLLDDMTDEEIEAGIRRITDVVAKTGISASNLARSLSNVVRIS